MGTGGWTCTSSRPPSTGRRLRTSWVSSGLQPIRGATVGASSPQTSTPKNERLGCEPRTEAYGYTCTSGLPSAGSCHSLVVQGSRCSTRSTRGVAAIQQPTIHSGPHKGTEVLMRGSFVSVEVLPGALQLIC